jgi:hypothetical protein
VEEREIAKPNKPFILRWPRSEIENARTNFNINHGLFLLETGSAAPPPSPPPLPPAQAHTHHNYLILVNGLHTKSYKDDV